MPTVEVPPTQKRVRAWERYYGMVRNTFQETFRVIPIMTTLQNVRTPVAAQEPSSQRFQQVLIWLLAFACAALAANIYYIQPLLETIAHSFSVPESQVGLIVTATQLGFALGLLLLVPPGDALNSRILISGTMLVLTLALIAVALAPSLSLLAMALGSDRRDHPVRSGHSGGARLQPDTHLCTPARDP